MDLADKIAALQRQKTAGGRQRQRAANGTSENVAAAATAVSNNIPSLSLEPRTAVDQDCADVGFIRRPNNSRTTPLPHQKKLFNPDVDPIPMRPREEQHSTAEPSISSSPPSRPPPRQLFDPRRDDPMRFTLLTNRANQQQQQVHSQQSSIVDQQSSMSSYTTTSSTFTLTTNTGSSHSSAPPVGDGSKDDNSVFLSMLKRVYREITEMEKKIQARELQDLSIDDPAPVVIAMLKPGETVEQKDPWREYVGQHQHLADLFHDMLTMILRTSIPSTIQKIVDSYSLPTRMWTNAFHHCLEQLRRASERKPVLLEHMMAFIYWSHQFYSGLYEMARNEASLMWPYRGFWMEALGDLARCRMTITARAVGRIGGQTAPLTIDAVPLPVERIDDTTPPSVGLGAADALTVEPEREIWRQSSQSWYALALADSPGAGRLHHHLGLLSREAVHEELRGVYHFVKSMTATHGFPTSRESILPLFSASSQSRRNLAEAKAPELFVLLHGMLFTHIQLDDFHPTLARYLERLQLDGAQEKEWIMMAVVNVAAILEYGKADGKIKPPAAPAESTAGKKRALVIKMGELAMDDSAAPSATMDIDEPEPTDSVPYTLQLSLRLAFSTLSFCLRHPLRRSSPFTRPTLNPYLTVFLTFLATILKQPGVLPLIERSVPWADLISFLETLPTADVEKEARLRTRLTAGTSPLPEDWCMRGMAWLGKRVYEHGFWKIRVRAAPTPGQPPPPLPKGTVTCESDVLGETEVEEQESDGIIEDDMSGEEEIHEGRKKTARRLVRVIRSALSLTSSVPGFELNKDTMTWGLGEEMNLKAAVWEEEERLEEEREEERRNRVWGDDEMEVDEIDNEEEEEVWDDNDEIRALQQRRQYLRNLEREPESTLPRRRSPLPVHPGFTILVLDTNVLLSALSMVASLVESKRWTVVIPLAVITELDGLSHNQSELGKAAVQATKYITDSIRPHSLSLKVQTSHGNYLTTLNVRSENFRTRGEGSMERSMDDLILKAAIWQERNWIDRSALLLRTEGRSNDALKVVLVSFDRNLRVKARSRELKAADVRDLAHIIRVWT